MLGQEYKVVECEQINIEGNLGVKRRARDRERNRKREINKEIKKKKF